MATVGKTRSKRKLRWGVIGTAGIADRAVVPAIGASRNGRVVAVASRDPERARAFAAAHSIPRAHGSYEALLEDESIDAVYVPLPNSMHRDWTTRATSYGKHVLCEKPLGLDAAECEEMRSAADLNGVKVMEAFMYRFHPRTERVVAEVRNGQVGRVRSIRAVFTFDLGGAEDDIRLDAALGGGALMDVGCYCVSVARTLAGREPISVEATAQWAGSRVDAQLSGVLRFENDLTADIECSLTDERCERYEVVGTNGRLEVPQAFVPGTGDAEIVEATGHGTPVRHHVPGADQYRLMVEHFADCVREDAEPRYPISDATANMKVIEAMYRSAHAEGGAVEVGA